MENKIAIANLNHNSRVIYTRAFQLEDVIQANGQTGRVVEKTILSTRIMTPDNEVITIPNASLFVNDITNYSSRVAPFFVQSELSSKIALLFIACKERLFG